VVAPIAGIVADRAGRAQAQGRNGVPKAGVLKIDRCDGVL